MISTSDLLRTYNVPRSVISTGDVAGLGVWKRCGHNMEVHSSILFCTEEHLEWALYCQVGKGHREFFLPQHPNLTFPFRAPHPWSIAMFVGFHSG